VCLFSTDLLEAISSMQLSYLLCLGLSGAVMAYHRRHLSYTSGTVGTLGPTGTGGTAGYYPNITATATATTTSASFTASNTLPYSLARVNGLTNRPLGRDVTALRSKRHTWGLHGLHDGINLEDWELWSRS